VTYITVVQNVSPHFCIVWKLQAIWIKTNDKADEKAVSVSGKFIWVIDTRKEGDFKNGHLPHSINLMGKGKFETWLGSIIKPGEEFYLVSDGKEQLQTMLERTAAIGYESQVLEGFVIESGTVKEEKINVGEFKNHQQDYTIVDVRNASEVKEEKIFYNSIFYTFSRNQRPGQRNSY
jgi:rhodanese-related sulfurtransferase